MQKAITPKANTSPLSVYGCNLNSSGGKKPGVPDLFTNFTGFIFSAKPKSINLHWLSDLFINKAFSNLRSR